jgi:hypothetical protein
MTDVDTSLGERTINLTLHVWRASPVPGGTGGW